MLIFNKSIKQTLVFLWYRRAQVKLHAFMMIRWKYLTFLLEKIYGIPVYMWDSSTLTPTDNLTLVKW